MTDTLEVLELKYTRAKLKTQTSARWLIRKTAQAARLQDKIRKVQAHFKETEREMVVLELQLFEAKGNIKKVTVKSQKKETITTDQLLSAVKGMPTKQRNELLAKLK